MHTDVLSAAELPGPRCPSLDQEPRLIGAYRQASMMTETKSSGVLRFGARGSWCLCRTCEARTGRNSIAQREDSGGEAELVR